jgi:hypothetical protein
MGTDKVSKLSSEPIVYSSCHHAKVMRHLNGSSVAYHYCSECRETVNRDGHKNNWWDLHHMELIFVIVIALVLLVASVNHWKAEPDGTQNGHDYCETWAC